MITVLPALLNLANAGDAPASDTARPALRVALFDDAGSAGKGVPRVTEQLGKVADIALTKMSGKEIADGKLKGFDVVIFTGGSGHKQADTLGEGGREEVRQFVRNGGGYVGICAGAYLACSGFDWGVGVLNAKTVSNKWERGSGTVKVEVTQTGKETVGFSAGQIDVRYDNGPIIQPDSHKDLPSYELVAFFRSELAKNGSPEGVMVNSPAIVRAECGKGRVIISSPHPEQTAGMEGFIEHAVRWVARKKE
jgi:glutamine amidotransferase-like uncharacterized protein